MHYLYARRKGCRKLSIAFLIHYTFLFFYPWLTNRHVKSFSLSYANLFYYCFVNNYRKFFIVLKLSYFTKIFGRCLQPIIIHDVLFTFGWYKAFCYSEKKTTFLLIILFNTLFPKIFNFTVLQRYLSY